MIRTFAQYAINPMLVFITAEGLATVIFCFLAGVTRLMFGTHLTMGGVLLDLSELSWPKLVSGVVLGSVIALIAFLYLLARRNELLAHFAVVESAPDVRDVLCFFCGHTSQFHRGERAHKCPHCFSPFDPI